MDALGVEHMRQWIWVLFMGSFMAWSVNPDPFIKPAKKILFNQRFQYLGYLKHEKKIWAYIKPVSRDIEHIGLGRVAGLGLVKTIVDNKVCIEKNHHTYCLYKSSQAGIWR